MSQEPLQNIFSHNPFKKSIILEKTSKNGPIEQKLVLHHKRNKRKTMIYDSIHDFDKEQRQEEKKSNMVENLTNVMNKDNKNKNIMFTGKRYLKFDNLLIKKEDLHNEEEKRKMNENKKNEKQGDNNGKAINPFKNVLNNFKNEDNKEENNNINVNSWKENPFKINNEKHGIFNNPFKILEKNEINKSNPFSQNPFLINKAVKNENPFKILDPPKNKNHENVNEKKNENINDVNTNNPFLASNLFTFSAFNLNNNNNTSTLNESKKEQSDDEDDKNVEEEVKIEKDENKLKGFKEVQYSQSNKFYETEIENLQFLERENGHSKYISKGSGLFTLQQEKDEKGKNVGIFVLRESSTKNIKLQGIILESTTVEKSKLKSGLEFIFVKNIMVKYSKYNADKLIEETKMTFLRIRINTNEIDNFYNKFDEFFNLIQK